MAFGIDDAIAAGLKIVNKFIPDPEARAKASKELRDSLQSWDKMQTAVNTEEAKHSSIFVAGWRPFVGWTCGSAFALHFVLLPIVNVGMQMAGKAQITVTFDMQTLLTVLMGMLGMGGLRTFEKLKGVARQKMTE